MLEEFTLIFDIDGTLCPIKSREESYIDLVPYTEMVQKLKAYKEQGAKIVLFTSRNMKTYHGNIGAINANTAKILLSWLDKWKIPYVQAQRNFPSAFFRTAHCLRGYYTTSPPKPQPCVYGVFLHFLIWFVLGCVSFFWTSQVPVG